MNADEYTLFPFDGVTRHWLNVVGDKKPISDYPPEFFAAVCKYADKKSVFQSEIFEGLRKWREYAERNPEAAPPVVTTSQPTDERERVERFKDLILAAVFYGHKDVIDALAETSTMTTPPGADMLGARVVIAAFSTLYKGGGKKNCPDKKELRAATDDIFNKAGLPILSDRQFTRILNEVRLGKVLRRAKPQPKRARR